MENNENIIIEGQEKKYSTPEILQIFHEYLQVNKKVIKIETKNNEAIWGCTLQEGDTILFDSEIIFQSKNEAKADVMYKYLKQNNLLNFSEERRKSAPKIQVDNIANQNPKTLLDTYLQKLNIIPTVNFTSPDFTCTISIDYKEKILQSQSQQSNNKKIASYDAAKDMLHQLSFHDEEASKLYRKVEKNYFQYGSPAPFEENDLNEFKASEFIKKNKWDVNDLKPTLKGNLNENRTFANYICAYLNSKKGGSIYYGIYDVGSIVYGYLLSDKERDELTQTISKTISTLFYPLIDSLVSIYFHPVEGGEEVEKKKRFILEISVARNPPEPVYWYKNSAFEKIENSMSLMRAELIYSRITSHVQSKPLLN